MPIISKTLYKASAEESNCTSHLSIICKLAKDTFRSCTQVIGVNVKQNWH